MDSNLRYPRDMQIVSYSIYPEAQQFCPSGLYDLYEKIDCLNAKELTWEDGIILSEVFKSCLNHLSINKNEKLELKLQDFLPKVSKIKNIHSIILDQAKKIDSILNPKEPDVKNCLGSFSNSIIPKSQNIVHYLKSREVNSKVNLENYKQELIINNIKEGNYTKTIFNDLYGRGFDIKNNLCATFNISSIKLWDLETGKCLWTVDPRDKSNYNIEEKEEKLKIINNRVIFSSIYLHSQKYRIIIFDIKTGNAISTILCDKFCMNGEKIFCLNNCNLEERDLEGKVVKSITEKYYYNNIENYYYKPDFFLSSGNFLSCIYYATSKINIYNLLKESEIKVILDGFPLPISSAYTEGDLLICGFDKIKENHPDCCVIDLKSGKIINQFLITEKRDRVVKLIKNKEWAFLGYSSGNIIAVNLEDKTHVVLGKHKDRNFDLSISGQILISASEYELNYWDIKSMEKIAQNKVEPRCLETSFVSGKTYILIKDPDSFIFSLICCDYLVSHRGEKVNEVHFQK